MTQLKAKGNILVIADTHEPFSHKHYLDFCIETYEKFNCKHVIHIGDLIDNHAASYHEHDPDGYSHRREILQAQKKLKKWFGAFPKVKLCMGNHDELILRQGRTHGLASHVFKSYRDIYQLPKGWEYAFNFKINNVLYTHGTSYSGKYPHATACTAQRMSVVIGHLHSVAGVYWTASENDIIFGMAVGCGIDRKRYAFDYGKNFTRKPILGAGVVSDVGRNAEFVPMKMG